MHAGGYGYVSVNTYSPIFYHESYKFLLFFFFLIRTQSELLILERRVFRCGVLSEHNFG